MLNWVLDRQGATLIVGGKSAPFQKKGRTVVFKAVPGEVYVLTPKGTRLAQVPVVKLAPRTDCSPARLGAVWYGNPEGANCHTATFPLW